MNVKMVGPELQAGICGQNMSLAAKSLGLGFDENWLVHAALCLGYPRFKQDGMVPRHHRPVIWFRTGAEGPETEE